MMDDIAFHPEIWLLHATIRRNMETIARLAQFVVDEQTKAERQRADGDYAQARYDHAVRVHSAIVAPVA